MDSVQYAVIYLYLAGKLANADLFLVGSATLQQ